MYVHATVADGFVVLTVSHDGAASRSVSFILVGSSVPVVANVGDVVDQLVVRPIENLAGFVAIAVMNCGRWETQKVPFAWSEGKIIVNTNKPFVPKCFGQVFTPASMDVMPWVEVETPRPNGIRYSSSLARCRQFGYRYVRDQNLLCSYMAGDALAGPKELELAASAVEMQMSTEQRLQDEIGKLKGELEASEERNRGLNLNLQTAWNEGQAKDLANANLEKEIDDLRAKLIDASRDLMNMDRGANMLEWHIAYLQQALIEVQMHFGSKWIKGRFGRKILKEIEWLCPKSLQWMPPGIGVASEFGKIPEPGAMTDHLALAREIGVTDDAPRPDPMAEAVPPELGGKA